jgi:MoxR-like ATPase
LKFTRKYFTSRGEAPPAEPPARNSSLGDALGARHYVFNESIELAVNAALATRRPLLVEGPPGSGKSSLAPAVAQRLGWWFYHRVLTSRMTAQDLLWEFDSIRRLHDAQIKAESLPPNSAYVNPGILWWAFDPAGAAALNDLKGEESGPGRPGSRAHAVVLLDQIDNADTDVPNDVLTLLAAEQFHVNELDIDVQAKRCVLLILTNSGERDLPPAAIRRCIRLKLEPHGVDALVDIAMQRFSGLSRDAIIPLAQEVVERRARAGNDNRCQPSTAEFLDAVAAARELDMTPEAPGWEALLRATLEKAEPLP